jgi:uncharacterized protein
MRRTALALCFGLLLSVWGCSSSGGTRGGDKGPPSPFDEATVRITTSEGPVALHVAVASTEEERARGLMERTSLPRDSGMLFDFGGPTRASFYMKDTKIPLSIGFFSAKGRLLEMFDMTPCRADPCRIYTPRFTYRRALEVERGTFARLGVDVGDRMRVPRSAES